MSVPVSKKLASLLFSEKANQLAHARIGARGRRGTNGLLVLSAVLGYFAGFSGLVNLVGKTWVSLIALAAGISTTGVILALTTLKYSDHLRAAAEYELLYLRTIRVEEGTPEGQQRFSELWEAFEQVVDRVHAAGAALNPDQVTRYEEEARAALRKSRYPDAEKKAEILKVG